MITTSHTIMCPSCKYKFDYFGDLKKLKGCPRCRTPIDLKADLIEIVKFQAFLRERKRLRVELEAKKENDVKTQQNP